MRLQAHNTIQVIGYNTTILATWHTISARRARRKAACKAAHASPRLGRGAGGSSFRITTIIITTIFVIVVITITTIHAIIISITILIIGAGAVHASLRLGLATVRGAGQQW